MWYNFNGFYSTRVACGNSWRREIWARDLGTYSVISQVHWDNSLADKLHVVICLPLRLCKETLVIESLSCTNAAIITVTCGALLPVMINIGVKPRSPLQWRHNGWDGVSNHHRLDCLLNRLFGRRLKETSKLCVTGICDGNQPVSGGFPSQRASYAEKVSIW